VGHPPYDADGNRVRKDVGTSWTEYVYFGQNVIAEKSASDWADYIFAGSKRIAQATSSATQYYWADHLGSTWMTVDSSGTPQCSAIYTPYGTEIAGCPTHYKFTGKERDSESGLDNFGARYYTNLMGRFMSVDPFTVTPGRVEDPQQLNLYSYVRNNPLKLVDPTGMLIDETQLSEDDLEKWHRIEMIAAQKDQQGNLLHPKLYNEIVALQQDSRTFVLEDSNLGNTVGGLTTITNFTADKKDFTRATLQLNFKRIKSISEVTAAKHVPGFNKYEGLLNAPIYRLAETFGHEAAHAIFAIQDPAGAVQLQEILNGRDAAFYRPHKYPLPPDLLQIMDRAEDALVPTETFAEQSEKIINGELQADKKKQ
jgi:RHS repeat-associated protein